MIGNRNKHRSLSTLTTRGAPKNTGLYLGLSLAAAVIGFAVFIGGQTSLPFTFLGFFMVVGGTLAATAVQFSLVDLKRAWSSLLWCMHAEGDSALERLQYLVSLSHSVRRGGLIQLDREADNIGDNFLRLALECAADGQTDEDIRRILGNEIISSGQRAERAVRVFESMGTYAPAMGLIGTILGLMSMLTELGNPEAVGPSMALALLTTLFGAVLSNLILLPIAGNIHNYADEQNMVKNLTLEGVLSLKREENPVVVEQKLQGFLPLVANM